MQVFGWVCPICGCGCSPSTEKCCVFMVTETGSRFTPISKDSMESIQQGGLVVMIKPTNADDMSKKR